MPTVRDRHMQLTDQQRSERIAELLARGVVRHLKRQQPDVQKVTHTGQIGLEVSRKTRLHVSAG